MSCSFGVAGLVLMIFSFGGDHEKCDKLNELLCQKAGFEECYDVS